MQKYIYLDHNATSPPSRDHLVSLCASLAEGSGNPSSPHALGRAASVALSNSRRTLAQAIGEGVEPREIVFVSGGSEANNLGTSGVLKKSSLLPSAQHAITSTIEHPSAMEPVLALWQQEGLQLTQIPVNTNGFFTVDDVIKNITPQTTLISLISAQNETGALQPVRMLGNFLHFKRWGNPREENTDQAEFERLSTLLDPEITCGHLRELHLHVDAVQAFAKVPSCQWFSNGIDSCSLSAHKLGALQGVGALVLRRGRSFRPGILGGAQEKNRRAGTENLPGIMSFALAASRVSDPSWWVAIERMRQKKELIYNALRDLPGVVMNSPQEACLPNTVHFSVSQQNRRGEDILVKLDLNGIYASSGSACSSSTNQPSRILLAMNRSKELAKNAIRLSLSPETTDDDVFTTIMCLKDLLSDSKT